MINSMKMQFATMNKYADFARHGRSKLRDGTVRGCINKVQKKKRSVLTKYYMQTTHIHIVLDF